DKEAMVEGVTSGVEEKADNILPTNFPYTKDVNVKSIDYDVKKAESLLDEAGWKLPKGKEVREKDGQPLEVELMYDSA
ncbi:ABC transporter substrate-binding protein, partial [Escherichia coli]|uniref:ABC transporter substrate-binding protein n=1 Tax=Escherichia coli TaxID=562 RepID=UPI001ED9C80C